MCLAIPGKIVSLDAEAGQPARRGRVSFGGILREVSMELLPEARTGDYVLVHVGVAISIVREEDARELFSLLADSGDKEFHELMNESFSSGQP